PSLARWGDRSGPVSIPGVPVSYYNLLPTILCYECYQKAAIPQVRSHLAARSLSCRTSVRLPEHGKRLRQGCRECWGKDSGEGGLNPATRNNRGFLRNSST